MCSYTLVSLFVVAFSVSTVARRPLSHNEVWVPRPPPPPPSIINITQSLNINFKKLGFFRSLEYCRRNKLNLATIPSMEVNRELTKGYARYDLRKWREGFWIGAYDMGHEGKFVWVSTGGAVKDAFTNWKRGEPNNKNGNENCLTMLLNGKWSDEKCSKERAFICGD